MSLTDNVVTAVTSTLTSQLGQFSITGADHPALAYQLLIDGKDVSATIRPRLMGMKIDDNRGFEADTIDIELDDSDGKLAMPRRGARMRVMIGWQGQPLVDKGGVHHRRGGAHRYTGQAHHPGQICRSARQT
ncbi:hypothetical protein [Aeromonas veronii]|uniref:hypothetical protein n=1 Tax=Aeromonas veronii TaxID=654 RepID=UPI00244384AF|nr:hypothetical protein [Aeromonas veronii]